MKHHRPRGLTLLDIMIMLAILALLAAILVPNLIRRRASNSSCKSNLKHIGTALEDYSTDYEGRYPRNLNLLTPDYLKTIPTCPKAGENTYYYATGVNLVYNTANFRDYYIVACEGPNHTSLNTPAGFPQYDGLRGLYER